MAPGWEMHGLNFTLGMQSMDYTTTTTTPTAVTTAPIYSYPHPTADTLRIEDLLDFTNLELLPSSAAANADAHYAPPPPPAAAIASEYRSTALPEDHFMPCEEAAELEWLSQFVEDSFSNNPYPPLPVSTEKLQLPNYPSPTASRSARSKRENHLISAAWAASAAVQSTSSSTSSSSSEFPSRASSASSSRRKRGGDEGDGGARRCTHCASEKTPQWRTGPMGPKTLCNACGVRFKSGRLVPEYRPASSPTFVLTQHSNSHRKVMELRRQKEHHGVRHDGGAVAGELLYHDYEVC